MPQARGSQLAINLYEEDTYGADPSVPVAQRIYATGCTLSSSQAQLEDDTLYNDRSKSKPDQGNLDVSGGIPMKLAAEDSATLLKHALGVVATYRPVVDTTTNVTGVVLNRAESTCPTGDGTLSFTAVGTTLSWTANGDTAGAAVDVSAGGDFTLQSGTAGAALFVTVTALSLPVTDKSDADITVAAAYEHHFTVGDLPLGLTIERDYGSNITGSGRFERFHGCRVGSMALNFPQNDYVSAEFQFMGASSTLDSALLDAAPNDNGHTSFGTASITTMEEGGSAITAIGEMSVTLDNGLDETSFALGSNARSELPEGMASISGSISGMFRDAALLTKAINNTTTSLRNVLTRGTGDGTAGNEYIETIVQNLVYERKSPEVSGPGGVRFNWAFTGFKVDTDLGLKMIVRNLVAAP